MGPFQPYACFTTRVRTCSLFALSNINCCGAGLLSASFLLFPPNSPTFFPRPLTLRPVFLGVSLLCYWPALLWKTWLWWARWTRARTPLGRCLGRRTRRGKRRRRWPCKPRPSARSESSARRVLSFWPPGAAVAGRLDIFQNSSFPKFCVPSTSRTRKMS